MAAFKGCIKMKKSEKINQPGWYLNTERPDQHTPTPVSTLLYLMTKMRDF